jgi:arylsulfatase
VTRIGLTLRVVTRVPQNHVEIKGYNGASGEGGAQGLLFELSPFNQAPESLDYALSRIDDIGGPKTYNLYPVAWGWAMNTPFQWFKTCW